MIPTTVRTAGGPWDVVYEMDGKEMGFITRAPAKRVQVSNTAPRIRVGSDAGYAEGAFDQLVLLGFETGQDLERFDTGERRVQWSDGNVAHYLPGRVTLASKWERVSGGYGTAPSFGRFVDFSTANGNYICLPLGTFLFVYDDATGNWVGENVGGGIGETIKHLYANDQYLFVSLGTAADAWRWDGTLAGTGGWTQLTGHKADAFGWYHEKLWRALGNEIYPADSSNDGTSWGTAVKVGWDSTDITDLYVANDYLLIAKPEGLYIYDETEVYQLVDATIARSVNNFKYGTSFQGALYVPWLAATHKLVITSARSSNISDITPAMAGDEDKERYGHGAPKVMFAGPRHLYIGTDDGEGQYPELLAYTGVGFHQLYRGEAGSTLYAGGYSSLKGWLLVCVSRGSVYDIYRKRIINTGVGEYADYAASGSFITPKLDGGYPDEMKAWRSVTIDAVDVDSEHTVSVSYRAEGTTGWVHMGTISTPGPNEIMFAGADGQYAAREMELKITLTRGGADITRTPRIEMPIIVRLLVSPTAVDAFNEVLILDENQLLRNGQGKVSDAYTMLQMLTFLDNLADSPKTIIRTDEFGRRFRVKVTNKTEEETRDPARADRSLYVGLRMMEMFSGVTLSDSVDGPVAAVSATLEEFDDWLTDADGVGLMDSKGFLLREAA